MIQLYLSHHFPLIQPGVFNPPRHWQFVSVKLTTGWVVCYRVFMLKHFLFFCLMLFSLAVHAGRFLPSNAQVGEINDLNYPDVTIDGEIYRLGAGARVYDTSNRMILSTQLPQNIKVFYLLDPGGFLLKIWLPTPDEEAGMNR